MARDFQSVNVAIWNDPDFRRLPPPAQHLYMMLWTSPGLSYSGVHDWRPARLTGNSHGLETEQILTIADSLHARHFLVPDEGTEEILIRSWVRWDGLMRKPRMSISFVKAYRATASTTLRGVLVHELHKVREYEPNLTAWADDRVSAILDEPRLSAKDLAVPADPFAQGFAYRFEKCLPQTDPAVCEAFAIPLLPAPSTLHPSPSTTQNDVTAVTKPEVARKKVSSADADGAFDLFWAKYPRKVAKQAAVKAFAKATKTTTPEEVMVGLRRYLPVWAKSEKQYIPHASTWLNDGRWEDEDPSADTTRPASSPARRMPQTAAEQALEAERQAGPPTGLTDEEYAAWWRRVHGRDAS